MSKFTKFTFLFGDEHTVTAYFDGDTTIGFNSLTMPSHQERAASEYMIHLIDQGCFSEEPASEEEVKAIFNLD